MWVAMMSLCCSAKANVGAMNHDNYKVSHTTREDVETQVPFESPVLELQP
jgi:hypothetical protein